MYFFVNVSQLMTSSYLEPLHLIKEGGGGGWGGGEGVFNTLQFSSITFTVCGGK